MRFLAAAISILILLSSCDARPSMTPEPSDSIDALAETYVRLVLALGEHDPDMVDAYLGPAEWREVAAAEKTTLTELARRAEEAAAGLARLADLERDEIEQLRYLHLEGSYRSLIARIAMLAGERLSFDEESRALYDAVAPTRDAAHYHEILDRLSAALPGDGDVLERYETFRNAFAIPRANLDAVLSAAIDACRERTREHIELPEGESFTVEYVTDKSWSGYNWYQGDFQSLIQINTDLPIYIDRILDLACHEGYPGHHVYNLLVERTLVRDRGWIEFAIYPLFSPRSLIAEGSANYGIDVAFPEAERIAFERETLFPLAGLDPEQAAGYYEVQKLVSELSYAGNEAARRYLDGEIDAAAAADWLATYSLMSRPRAEQRVRFIDQYRSYVINYNLGEDLVRTFIESRGGTAEEPERRWQEFADLLSSPRLPSQLLQPAQP